MLLARLTLFANRESRKTIRQLRRGERRAGERRSVSGWRCARCQDLRTVGPVSAGRRWNEFEWRQVPGTNKSRRIARPVSAHVVTEKPRRRIIDDRLWDQVQARFSRRKHNRPGGSSKREPSLLSGLLRCGACGGSFSVIGRRIKKGVYHASLGCSANRSRGDAICANNRTVSERKVTQAVVEALRQQLTMPKLLQDFVTAFKKRFTERHGAEAPELAGLERELAASEGRIRNLTDALGKMGFSRAIPRRSGSRRRSWRRRKPVSRAPGSGTVQTWSPIPRSSSPTSRTYSPSWRRTRRERGSSWRSTCSPS